MSLIDTAKDIYELAKKGATLELQERLIKIREEALSLQEENLKLRARVSELEAALSVRENLSFDGSAYWRSLEEGKREGPYCQRCYDADGKLIRLQSSQYVHDGQHVHSWLCRALQQGV